MSLSPSPASARTVSGASLAPPARLSLIRRASAALVGTGRGRILLAVLATYVVFQAWLSLMASGKITEGFDPDRPRLNVLVTLSFPPERFHVLFFQRHGRVSGTDGNTIEVRGVPRAEMTRVARPYWVRRVEPLKD
jgi:hypothetical protein